MADKALIKRNLGRMIDAQAPESDLNAYLASEGYKTLGDWQAVANEPDRAPAEVVPRIAGQAVQGTMDAITRTVGAPVDLVAAGLGKLGMPIKNPIGGSESLKGAGDWLASIPGKLGITTPDAPVRYEPETRGEKIGAGVGEGIGTVLSTILPAGAIASRLPVGTVGQGVAQTLASQPVTQLASGAIGGATTGATDNPWLGAAASLATPLAVAGGQRLISPVTNQLAPQQQRLVDLAQRPVGDPAGGAGMTLTPAQQTGSRTLGLVEETMARMPLASGPMRGAFDTQRGQFSRAVNERAGIAAADASPETLTRAFQQQGQTFDSLASRTTVNLDQHAAQRIQQVAQDYGRRLPTDVAPIFQSYMDDLAPYLAAPSRYIPGELYARMRTGLTTTIRENQNNPTLQRALGGVVETLDDAVERSTSGALRQEWQDARRQYQALMTIDKAMQGGTADARSRGDIPFGALTSAVRGSDRSGYARGRGQMNELSRLGDYLAPKIPNSGTPERSMVQNVLTGGLLGGGALATGVGAPAAIGAAVAPWAISKMYNSPVGRAYLTNQLAGDRVSPTAALAQQLVGAGLSESADDPKKKRLLAQLLMRANEQRVR